MEDKSILFKKSVTIEGGITINIPSVFDVLENEDIYFGLVSICTSSPFQYMVQLDDIGIDYTTITDYEMFLIFAPYYFNMDTSIVFGNLNANDFSVFIDSTNDTTVLYSPSLDIKIDELVYTNIAKMLRVINLKEKDNRKPGNENAKEYLIEKERKRLKRLERKKKDIKYKYESDFENLIIGLVNNEKFKYDFETVQNISIYQFYKSLKQIQTDINFNNTMRGVYSGTIDITKIKDKSSLSWIMSSN